MSISRKLVNTRFEMSEGASLLQHYISPKNVAIFVTIRLNFFLKCANKGGLKKMNFYSLNHDLRCHYFYV